MNFIEYKYKDIGKIRSGKRLKKGFIVSDKKSNNRYIRVRDINNGIIDVNNVQYISDEAASYITRYKVSKNDIIISVVGTVGSVASIPNELDGAFLTENCNNLLVDEKICLKEYLKYFLLSKDGQAEIISHIVGTTQPKLPIYGIEAFNIKVPEKECQNKIITILNTINNKILLNTHINNNLYKTFRSIYKNTFLNKTTNTIKFSDFNEIGNLVMGQSPKGSSYNEEKIGLPLINGAADYKDGMLNPNKYTSEPTRVCNAKDLVFCIRATIGQLTIADQEYCLGRGVACISNINELYYEYVFNIIEESIDKLKAVATGSVILGLSKDDINNLEVYKPTLEEIEKFHKLEQPILNRIIEIKKQNKTLEQIRDTLLPKLMNGEIDLDKIEI